MKVLRIADVVEKVGLSKTTIYRREKEGRFPTKLSLGPGCVGWIEEEVDEFLRVLAAKRKTIDNDDAK